MANTHFALVSPSATLFSGEAEMIVCKSVDGEIAFLADHMPYIGALDPAAVRVVGADGGSEELRFAVRGGFVEVKDNQVIMLADLALTPSEVDVAQAERDEQDASSRVGTGPEPDKTAERDLKWAHARLEVART